MNKLFTITAALALLGLSIATQAIVIDTVAIGNPGNAADTVVMNDDTTSYGSVGYNYNIGKYEVTAAQYTAFLNAVANVSDTYGLYNSAMWSSSYGCRIQQTSISGGYSYSVASDYANRPVNYVSFWDACRFANWLSNGQGTGSTETGTYTIPDHYNGQDGRTIQRNANWTWAVASEDEWYKAAYYRGDGLYSLYANGTSTAPGMETDSNYGGTDGTYSTPWDGTIHGALEQNGTKDMMGNVWEWNEDIVREYLNYSYRGLRGGSVITSDADGALQSSFRNYRYPVFEDSLIGFRVSQVPEPSSIIALLGGLAGVLGMRRRRV